MSKRMKKYLVPDNHDDQLEFDDIRNVEETPAEQEEEDLGVLEMIDAACGIDTRAVPINKAKPAQLIMCTRTPNNTPQNEIIGDTGIIGDSIGVVNDCLVRLTLEDRLEKIHRGNEDILEETPQNSMEIPHPVEETPQQTNMSDITINLQAERCPVGQMPVPKISVTSVDGECTMYDPDCEDQENKELSKGSSPAGSSSAEELGAHAMGSENRDDIKASAIQSTSSSSEASGASSSQKSSLKAPSKDDLKDMLAVKMLFDGIDAFYRKQYGIGQRSPSPPPDIQGLLHGTDLSKDSSQK